MERTASGGKELGAAALTLIRCRERAGNKLRSRRDSCEECLDEIRDVPAERVAAALGPEGMARVGNPDPRSLVAGGADSFALFLRNCGYTSKQAAAAAEKLEVHAARTLFDQAPPEVPVGFIGYLNRMIEEV